jgi:phosphotransferase system enzyme I (PtsP)
LLKAAAGRELKLMLPMVTELGEITQAREIIDVEVRHLSRHGHPLPTTSSSARWSRCRRCCGSSTS